jgi:hypothetical protein
VLAVLAFTAFVIAGVLELVKAHLDLVIWLVIVGGLLLAADMAWGWYGRRYPRTPG